jgi:hypothetical protein
MQVQPAHQSWVSYLIMAGVIIVVVGLRLRSASKMQRLKLGSLWVVPALYLGVAAMMLAQFPPTGWVWIACVIGLALGAALGWQRGRMMHISVDPETHALSQKASPAAMLFLVALIAIRAGGKILFGTGSGLSPAMLTDPLIAFALGMFTLQRVEMYLRAKRLLGEAQSRA